ncbi:polysaccharide deacetylase family protein [Ornithinibacillus halotolerans]|uniref:Polysaccharide deacetylase n=1 Tax=Ornithinibacillus halotolerans TaxID=1274357 RepID=A0A916S1P4_9BACI|nr:polysaccharide deacetylase family protein [Ornithinibacillus halotolerans]GGA79587.1 polysaccharide deacetylase [Ornithinibacillus halotolerans]
MRRVYLFLVIVLLVGCHEPVAMDGSTVSAKEQRLLLKDVPKVQSVEINMEMFRGTPKEWGENVTGVKQRFVTERDEIALTFDACGGPYGNGVDEDLITFLRAEQIPATLFVNERWILENEKMFLSLANDPLFQIENHGTAHSPLSVNGGEAWGIPATTSPEEAYEEIMRNHRTVMDLTGHSMTLFRSGTAFYDEIAVQLANSLGYEVVNFDVLGDAGATFSASQVEQALLSARPGSIILLHMNQPTSGTADGVKAAIPQLLADGFEFVLLDGKELE